MSAFDEIKRRGDAGGEETVALLRRLGAQVARRSPFPPPDGHGFWTSEAVDDLLAEMFASRGPQFVIACYTRATDQASLERLVLTSIKNFLIDQAKSTTRGKLRRRLRTILGDDGRFEHVARWLAWALAAGPKGLWQGDIDQLYQAASRVRGIEILSWNTAGRTSVENVGAITAVSHAVVSDASGAVSEEDLSRVVERRFALIAPPQFVTLPDGRFDFDSDTGVEPASDASVWDDSAAERAREIWAGLSHEERALLPVLGETLSTRMGACGKRRATTEALTRALVDRLRLATIDDDDRDEIVRILAEMAGATR